MVVSFLFIYPTQRNAKVRHGIRINSNKSYTALSSARLSNHRRSMQHLNLMRNIREWTNETKCIGVISINISGRFEKNQTADWSNCIVEFSIPCILYVIIHLFNTNRMHTVYIHILDAYHLHVSILVHRHQGECQLLEEPSTIMTLLSMGSTL
jgi:hypothetical protein